MPEQIDMWVEVMKKLNKLGHQRVDLEKELRAMVDTARQPALDGRPLCTWQEIADMIGGTKQSAHQRYAPSNDPGPDSAPSERRRAPRRTKPAQ